MGIVLVVDDEAGIRRNIEKILVKDQHEVHCARDVEEALDILGDFDVDVVISDIVMPKASGVELLKLVSGRSPEIQVILITGEPTIDSAAEAVRAGAYDYLTKPFSIDVIRKTVNGAIRIKRLEDENHLYREHLEELVRQRSKELIESEKKYRVLFSNAGDGIFLNDLDGNILNCNDVASLRFGFSRDEFLSMKFSKLDDRPDRKRYEEMQASVLEKGRDIFDIEIRTKSGGVVPVEINATLVHFGDKPAILAILRDIGVRREAEHALRVSEQRYRMLVENAPLGILSVDPDGRITDVNNELVKILGSPSMDATRKINIYEFQNLVEAGISKDIKRCQQDGESFISERPYLSKWGKQVFLRCHFRAVREDSNKITGVLGIVEDVSVAKGIEEENAKLEGQLRQSQKMEAVGRLAGGVAHDFNNLLTGISGHISLAQLDLDSKDPLYETLNEISEATDRAADLTHQLLAFSRKQMIKPRVFNVNELVLNLKKMLVRIIGEDVQLETKLARSLGQVKADPGQVEQIIINLAVNARDAMPDGGQLAISTEAKHLDEQFCSAHDDLIPGEYIELSISDTGHGMDEKVSEHIFDPFFTTKDKEKGTGLGLSTVYGIVKQHAGEIVVESELGLGTTFKVYFPLVLEKAEPISRGSKMDTLPRGEETILVVEDEAIVRNMVEKILKRLGYQVLIAEQGGDALLTVDRHEGPIDLLITDVVMPHMNGAELSRRLQIERPSMKVLFTSGYTEDVIAHHGIINEGINFLPKPYSPKILGMKVREVIDS